MSAPLIWIIIPLVLAVLLFILRRWKRLVYLTGVLLTLLLTLLAWRVPIGVNIIISEPISFPVFAISQSLTLLGRQFILDDTNRYLIVIIYLSATIWFIGAPLGKASREFIPLGIAIATLLLAAISIQIFLYSAFFIYLAVLVSIPIISPPGKPVTSGVLRFLSFQTIGMVVLLASGWMISLIDLQSINSDLAITSIILVSIGFILIIAVFPFNTWIPMLAETSNPYMLAFILFVFPQIISLFGLGVLLRYPWMQDIQALSSTLIVIGVITILGGGIFSAIQTNLSRIFAYAVISEIGFLMLIISQIYSQLPSGISGDLGLFQSQSIRTLLILQVPAVGLNFAIWGLSLSIIYQSSKGGNFGQIIGIAHKYPIASITLLFANLSMASFPLLASFPSRILVGRYISSQSEVAIFVILIGYSGLLLAALRSLGKLVTPQTDPSFVITESRSQISLLVIGCIFLFSIGLFPQLFLVDISPFLQVILQGFP